MEILKGIQVANAINEKLIEEAKELARAPHLGIVRVGEKPDDLAYERGALKKMEKVGFAATVFSFPTDITQDDFMREFQKVNEDPEIDGILLFKPLPKHLDEKAIECAIDPKKDLDGISPVNQAKVYAADASGYAPCTAEAVVEMLDHAGIDPTGKRVTVVGRSLVIGKPVTMLLMKKNATVTVCHTRTKDVEGCCRQAEILVAAAGVAKMIGSEHVSDGAVVIDVGINVDAEGNLCGDVDFDSVCEKTSLITPVPGGVGSVTTSVLAKHLLKAAKQNQ
ncbi:MAG: bifunctional 5,10-methylene-tetrahydrofolate dehydrogenase/5,10-methylene-tetrahydrofolate cyclohydrolase [Lachnospiraceae bacterium]|nr:bifunctional 5,10-methylene-tetrahydrofolate dehydrogenase/5,10-methylene-tetrahydrofolate cyclohydrolase [Lachnospiraceae bacterium]